MEPEARHDLVATRFMLGGAQIGGLYRRVDDRTAEATLQAAWDRGVRRFDTAPHYGAGLSERRLGSLLRQFPRDSFTLCTKVGRLLVDTDSDTDGDAGFFGGDRRRRVLDYTGNGVRRSLAESLQRLGLDRIDIALIHDPDDHLEQAIDEAYPALHELRSQGVLASVGAGMNFCAPLTRIVRETDVDTVMIAGRYTLLDQSAAFDLLPACTARGVSVIAAGVFNSGLLADPKPGATYDYSAAPAHLMRRARNMQQICAAYGVEVRAAAIQFPLRSPTVTTVCVGARNPAQVNDNADMLIAPIPAALWDELHSVTST
jgi:D-threo-aldose 1-dehydrogenase